MNVWKITVEGASKTKVLSLDGVPMARFYAGRGSPALFAQIEAALNAPQARKEA